MLKGVEKRVWFLGRKTGGKNIFVRQGRGALGEEGYEESGEGLEVESKELVWMGLLDWV